MRWFKRNTEISVFIDTPKGLKQMNYTFKKSRAKRHVYTIALDPYRNIRVEINT